MTPGAVAAWEMRRIRAWLLVSALFACLAAAPLTARVSAATGVALASVESCISQLDSQSDIGYERIAARCPDLTPRLEHSEWALWLPPEWKEPGNELSARGLKELEELGVRETAMSGTHGPDIRSLHAVLARVAPPQGGAWYQFRAWIRSVLEPNQEAPDSNWYARMVANIGFSEATLELAAYIALGGVVVLAGVIVVGELRNAGLLVRRGGGVRAPPSAQAPARPLQWDDIERSPWVDRPRLLLDLLVTRLGEREDLPPSSGLTVRELARAARLEEADRRQLADLALAAERVRFSDQEIPQQELEGPLAGGLQLLQRLERAGA